VQSREQWEALVRECTAGEFQLADPPPSGFPDFEWLSEEIEVQLPAAASKQAISRLVLQSSAGITSPWLVVGGSNFTYAFRRAALHSFAAAAAEIQAERPGIWLHAAKLYAEGRWPFGITPAGQLVVL
jgi:hypothetical protein